MDLDSASGADSLTSTPRSISDEKSTVRLMVSFGGKIIPRPHDNQLRYVGGDTRIIAVNRSTTFSLLLSKLSKLLSNSVDFTVKYQLPNEELDALITVSTDEDVENMMEEFDRLTVSSSNRVARLRLFLFPSNDNNDNNDEEIKRSSSIVSLLDGSRKRESWFLDALNGGSASSLGLERNKSEASSIVSEVPDYLFGLDNNSDDLPPPPVKFRTKSGLSEAAPGSDPGSPAFGSGSSAPPMPNLPPVKTKPEKTNMSPVEEVGGPVYGPGSPYLVGGHHAVQHNQQYPVYYVPATGSGPGMVGHRNVVPVSVPVQRQYVAQYGPGPVPVPMGYPGPGLGPMYDVPMQGNMNMNMNHQQQTMYYGVKNGGLVATYSGSGPIPGDDRQDGSKGRTLQG